MVAGPYLLPVRRSDANCRQFYQRPLRLPQRNRPRRPAGTGTSLRTRLDFTESHAKRNHRHRPVRLSDRICAVVLCRMGADHSRTSLRTLRFPSIPTGPYPLSYNGWGDVLVIVFFGFVPVGGTYYVQALTWTSDTTVASLICGLLIDTLLVVNNYRDREADARSGKRTVIVRFGEKFGRYLYLMLGWQQVFCASGSSSKDTYLLHFFRYST